MLSVSVAVLAYLQLSKSSVHAVAGRLPHVEPAAAALSAARSSTLQLLLSPCLIYRMRTDAVHCMRVFADIPAAEL